MSQAQIILEVLLHITLFIYKFDEDYISEGY